MDRLNVSATATDTLIAIEMAAAIACYVPASYLADRFGKQPFVVVTFGFLDHHQCERDSFAQANQNVAYLS